MNSLDKIKEYFLRDKKRLIILAAALLGALLVIVSSGGGGESEAEGDSETLAEYKARLEEELEELCSSVEGAGKCRVTVSFSSGETVEYRGSNVVGRVPPIVQGVTVIADGGGEPSVKRAIADAMTALFDIGSNRVAVLEAR